MRKNQQHNPGTTFGHSWMRSTLDRAAEARIIATEKKTENRTTSSYLSICHAAKTARTSPSEQDKKQAGRGTQPPPSSATQRGTWHEFRTDRGGSPFGVASRTGINYLMYGSTGGPNAPSKSRRVTHHAPVLSKHTRSLSLQVSR